MVTTLQQKIQETLFQCKLIMSYLSAFFNSISAFVQIYNRIYETLQAYQEIQV
jgi:hypothetical protein